MDTAILGSIVALVTPMHEDGSLDLAALKSLIDWHVESGTSAIVSVGTTGESAALSPEEHVLVLKTTIEHARGRIPVIAGAGANSTSEAIELTKHAKNLGADATLQVVPYYNKPTQEGIYKHFERIAECVDLPVILYNVPGRTVADMSNDTILRLAKIPGIVGVKDATGNLERGLFLLKSAPEKFSIYSGDDATATMLMLMGGQGNISVTANVAPASMAALCKAAMNGDVQTSRRLHIKLLELHKNLFVQANPIPVKWALHYLGLIPAGIRLPLTELEPCHHAVLKDALAEVVLGG